MSHLNARRLAMAVIALSFTILTLSGQNTPKADLTIFAGTWKEDLSKSGRTVSEADTRKYEQNSDGSMSITIGANIYHDTFRVDGKPHPIVPRPEQMQTWIQINPSTWQSKITEDGRLLLTIRRTVSTDGMTLTHATTWKTKEGKNVTETIAYERISAEKSGLVGTWKPISDHVDVADEFSFRLMEDGSLAYSGLVASYTVKPDGQQHTMTSSSQTVSLVFSGDRTLELTFFMKGKPVEIDKLSVSPDGESIKEIDRDPANNAQTGVTVYQKQPTVPTPRKLVLE